MAHIWFRDSEISQSWSYMELQEQIYNLGEQMTPMPVSRSVINSKQRLRKHPFIIPTTTKNGTIWVLSSPAYASYSSICINGEPLLAPLKILHHKDYLYYNQYHAYFSTEEVVKVTAFKDINNSTNDNAEAVYCPRCKDRVLESHDVVRCPGCSLLYHQDEQSGLTCFTYGESCSCGYSTSLNEQLNWTPEAE